MELIKGKVSRILHLIFVAPSMIFIFLLAIVPLAYAVYLSFQNYKLTMPNGSLRFIGIENYVSVIKNEAFIQSIGWTLIFSFFAVIISVGIGLFLAVLLTNSDQSQSVRLLKSFLILPMMVAPVVSSTMWKILFGAVYGPINYLIELFQGTAVSWTGETLPARLAIVVIDSWGSIPFCMLIFLGALTTIPDELYESALIDGSSPFNSFRKITLPLIRNFISLVVSLRLMDSLKVFDPIMIMTDGGPSGSTESIGTMMYKIAFRYMDIGQGSAAAVIFFIIIAIVSITTLLLTRKEEVK
ncbi:sugar ABC transporter permease [Enterococcus gallinarum]|uniref:carbohydrate ABC transporter permease n=1 Tax=Enterococcus gallinarum TaxID=1353 RepID=UPI001D115C9C|nr:sugar ABC transporter permease [Enterococcus gallinarum]MCC2752596.1 sugar ABC transporter permease [Enterococcus gallinarum]MCD5184850.1 sugar ABC transporter permease [Enterococcus gallinarum]MEB6064759.1 sugar ABC transporter permease [Enterococcus gallinarum]